MKKKLCLLVALMLVLSLGGCKGKTKKTETKKPELSASQELEQLINKSNSENKTDAVDEAPVEAPAETPVETGGSYADAQYMEPFQEDRAWARYKDENYNGYLGLIDKSGKVLFSVRDTGAFYSSFENGYANLSLHGSDYLYTLDKNGTITSQISRVDANGNRIDYAYGGGYIMTKVNVSNFDTVGYQYTVYNPDGSVNGTFQTSDEGECTYIGSGIFRVKMGTNYGYYCAKANKWLLDDRLNGFGSTDYTTEDGKVIIGTYWDNATDEEVVLVLTENGDLREYRSSVFWRGRISNIADNCCVVSHHSHELYVYHFDTQAVYELDESYRDKVPEYFWSNDVDTPTDGRVVVPAKGADGNNYSYVFDTQFHLINGPIQGNCGASSEGMIYGFILTTPNDEFVADQNGNYLFSVTEKNLRHVEGVNYHYYSSGVLLLQNNKRDYVALDTKGNVLFDKLNLTNAKYPTLE